MDTAEVREGVQLIAYADRFGGSVGALREVLDGPLAGLFTGVHILPFFTPFDGAARLPALSHVMTGNAPAGSGERFVAECRALDGMDELVAGPRVAALKIDVEDHEHQVLAGARRLLATHRPLLFCELWETENRSLSLALARELGYHVWVRESGALVPFDPGRHRVLDFYLLPEETARA